MTDLNPLADARPGEGDRPGLPTVITPLESTYIRAAAPLLVPILNQLLDATNLDVVLHLTAITQSQVNKGLQGLVVLYTLFTIVHKRLKDGNDPRSSAPKIVLTKPEPQRDPDPAAVHDEFGKIVASIEAIPPVPDPPAPGVIDRRPNPAGGTDYTFHAPAPGLTDEELIKLIRDRHPKPPPAP